MPSDGRNKFGGGQQRNLPSYKLIGQYSFKENLK